MVYGLPFCWQVVIEIVITIVIAIEIWYIYKHFPIAKIGFDYGFPRFFKLCS
jgi:hypothetical protein